MTPLMNISVLQLVANLWKLSTFFRDKIALTHGLGCPKFYMSICTFLVHGSILIIPSAHSCLLCLISCCKGHSTLANQDEHAASIWQMNAMERDKGQGRGEGDSCWKLGWQIQMDWLFYACKNGLHCSKMNMLMPLIFPIYSSCIFSSKLEFSIWFCSPSLQNARCHQYCSTLLSYMNMWLLTKTAIPHFQDPCSQSLIKMHVQPKKKKEVNGLLSMEIPGYFQNVAQTCQKIRNILQVWQYYLAMEAWLSASSASSLELTTHLQTFLPKIIQKKEWGRSRSKKTI